MKNLFKIITFVVIVFFSCGLLKAQVPQGINYQAVLRNSNGQIRQNQRILMRFSIHKNNPSDTIVYREIHDTSTNNFGLVNLQIGKGIPNFGIFSLIQWGTGLYFLEVDADPGTGYVPLGTTQFFAVPYAMVAEKALSSPGDNWGSQTAFTNSTLSGNGTISNPLKINQQGAFNGQTLKWNGTTWLPKNDSVGTGTVTSISTSTGLTGGTIIDTGTIRIANTGVPPGSYGNLTTYPTFTVNAQGQLTLASNLSLPDSLPPKGLANGDLSGKYPNPTVAKIQGFSVSNSAPSTGQTLKWNGAAWMPANDSVGPGTITSISTGTGLTGGPIIASGTIALANTTVTVGSYGNTSNYPTFSVNAQGQLTNVVNQALPTSFPPNGTAGGDLANTYPNPTVVKIQGLSVSNASPTTGQALKWNGALWLPANDSIGTGTVTSIATGTGLSGGPIAGSGTISLANTTVTAGTYGNTSNYPTFIVNAQGQLTNAGSQSLPAALPPNGSAGGDLSGTYPNPNVVKIRGKDISATAPSSGQVLLWNGTSWAPSDISSIYIVNSGNYTSVTPGNDKIVNVQGTITLSANYNNLSNLRTFVSGGIFDGSSLYSINFSNNSVVSGVTFNNIEIGGGTNLHFINCSFNNVTSFPFGCSLSGCQINNSTVTTVTSIGFITNSSISNSTIPRLTRISNSSISGTTIGNSTNFLSVSSNNRYSSSIVYLSGAFSGNYCDDTRILGFNTLSSVEITGNTLIATSMSTNTVEINVAGSFRYAVIIANNSFLGNSTAPVGEHIKITGTYTGTRCLTKINNNIAIGGTSAVSQFITISTSGPVYHIVNDNDYEYTGSLGVSNGTYITVRNNLAF